MDSGLLISLALLLAFLLGMAVAWRWSRRRDTDSGVQVHQNYLKGLNFVLNEQPDKAIEVFIKALEVDSETVELHLALGGLFRRNGQVDRATRIHQNLIARPSLTEEQRLQAIFELAQDYYKAGLLDRAENLYLELRDSATYRYLSIEGLSTIYQTEKEWMKAIEVNRQHRRSDRLARVVRVAHYWCELAEIALERHDFDAANKFIKSAIAEDRTVARSILIKGQLSFLKHDYAEALKLWQGLVASNPELLEQVLDKIISCYQQLSDGNGLREFIINLPLMPKNAEVFERWSAALNEFIGEQEAINQILSRTEKEGLSASAADYLLRLVSRQDDTAKQQSALLKNLLGRAKADIIEYTCVGCGFDTKAMHWLCVNCGEWDSFH